MLKRLLGCVALVTVFGGQAPSPSPSPGFEVVQLVSLVAGGATLTGQLKRPDKPGRLPAVVALHGCGGVLTAKGQVSARDVDWADRFAAAGYVVLFPDSFNPRGFRQICTLKAEERTIRPRDRAEDAAAAIAWLANQPFVDPARIALIGWSHGGSTVLWSVRGDGPAAAAKIKTAIAFYPGCRVPSESKTWQARSPLAILIGDADDWTPPESCRVLKANHPAIRLIEYPGAVHGFDAPNSPLRTRTDVGQSQKGDGRAKVGTDPKARASAIDEVQRILADAFK